MMIFLIIFHTCKLREIFLKSLREKIFSKNPILVNGQSGDFNTGLHIPRILFDIDKKDKVKNLVWVLEAIKKTSLFMA